MSDLLSGLASLGLGKLEGMEVFEAEKKPEETSAQVPTPKVVEKDIIYDRGYECPVCDKKITAKTVKAG